jgi:hypothetical protein
MVCTSWGNDLISSDVESMTRHEKRAFDRSSRRLPPNGDEALAAISGWPSRARSHARDGCDVLSPAW